MALQNTDLFVVDRGGVNYKMAADQVTAKTSATGASILPGGTDAQRPTPAVGMTRWNSDRGFLEVYTGASVGWNQLDYVGVPDALPPDLTISANTSLNDGTYFVNNFTLNAGVTLTTTSQAIVLICTGTATINGTVQLTGLGQPGGSSTAVISLPGSASLTRGGEGFGAGAGRTNINGLAYPATLSIVGSGGSSGALAASNGGGVLAPQGGKGGGGFLLKSAKGITVGATAQLIANGTDAGLPSDGVGDFWTTGAGGGSGGVIVLRSAANITVAGSVSVRGGNGGVPITSIVTPLLLNGGGGGGGGIVILQADGSVNLTGTVSLNGGTAGAYITGSTVEQGAGGGGGCGGRGGSGSPLSVYGGPQINGSPGVLLYQGSPL
jgi:hypothetical protein